MVLRGPCIKQTGETEEEGSKGGKKLDGTFLLLTTTPPQRVKRRSTESAFRWSLLGLQWPVVVLRVLLRASSSDGPPARVFILDHLFLQQHCGPSALEEDYGAAAP